MNYKIIDQYIFPMDNMLIFIMKKISKGKKPDLQKLFNVLMKLNINSFFKYKEI